MTEVTHLPGTERVVVFGPKRFGNKVIVDGRTIPGMAIVQAEGGYDLFLDDRFSIFVEEKEIYPVAWMVANALAIGAGYKHIGHEKDGSPFAPQIAKIVIDE